MAEHDEHVVTVCGIGSCFRAILRVYSMRRVGVIYAIARIGLPKLTPAYYRSVSISLRLNQIAT